MTYKVNARLKTALRLVKETDVQYEDVTYMKTNPNSRVEFASRKDTFNQTVQLYKGFYNN